MRQLVLRGLRYYWRSNLAVVLGVLPGLPRKDEEQRTGGEQHVALMHGHIGFVSAMHAQHADKLRIRCGIGA